MLTERPVPVWICQAPAPGLAPGAFRRGIEQARIGARYLGPGVTVALRTLPVDGGPGEWMEEMRGGVVWLSAGAAGAVSAPTLAWLRERNRAVVADWVTDMPHGAGLGLVDGHVFASLAAYRAARRHLPKARLGLVAACPDERLRDGPRAPSGPLSAVWRGPLSREVRHDPRIAALDAEADPAAPDPRLAAYNCHVAVGNAPGPLAPLLDVFEAAAVGAVAIVERSRDDAVDYLGRDYPYLAEDSTAEAGLAILDHAARSFDRGDWHRARERMANVADRSSPGTVASDLARILSETAAVRFGVPVAA